MRLVFATGNKGKLREAEEILGADYEILSPGQAGVSGEAEENGSTFKENSLLKAQHLYGLTALDCFADDSGLEVDALGGAPGIYSARYAALPFTSFPADPRELLEVPGTPDHIFSANIDKLLSELGKRSGFGGMPVESRAPLCVYPGKARFRCVLTLILGGQPHFFEGTVEGRIATGRAGCGGFGYDPVFVPDMYPDRTVAELSEDAKNAISHRGVALRKMAAWLKEQGAV